MNEETHFSSKIVKIGNSHYVVVPSETIIVDDLKVDDRLKITARIIRQSKISNKDEE